MSAVRNPPELDSQAPATEVSTAEQGPIDLAKLDLESIALAQFRKSDEAVAAAKETLAGVVHDLSTTTKLNDAKSLRQRLVNAPLADARKLNTGLKSKLAAVSKAIGVKLTEIEAGFNAADQLITPQIEAREAAIAEEKRIAEEQEAARIAAIQSRIESIKACAVRAQAADMTAARIQKGIDQIEAIAIDDSFAEFQGAAAEAKSATLASMAAFRDLAKAREDEAARLEAQRIENERIAAEQAAQAERLAAQQRALDEQAAKIAAAQKAIDDARAEAARKEREAQEAAARAEQMAILEREREAEEKAMRAATSAVAAPVVAAPVVAAPAVVVRAIHPAAAALRNEQPTLKLGTICDRLGFTVSAAFLAELGFEASMDKRACLYRESDWNAICHGISAHALACAAEAIAA